MKEDGLALERYEEECDSAMTLLAEVCEEVCDEMWPIGKFGISILTVWCLRDDKTQTCALLELGDSTDLLPPDVVTEMLDRLAGYGVCEKPDWFPVYGEFEF